MLHKRQKSCMDPALHWASKGTRTTSCQATLHAMAAQAPYRSLCWRSTSRMRQPQICALQYLCCIIIMKSAGMCMITQLARAISISQDACGACRYL